MIECSPWYHQVLYHDYSSAGALQIKQSTSANLTARQIWLWDEVKTWHSSSSSSRSSSSTLNILCTDSYPWMMVSNFALWDISKIGENSYKIKTTPFRVFIQSAKEGYLRSESFVSQFFWPFQRCSLPQSVYHPKIPVSHQC